MTIPPWVIVGSVLLTIATTFLLKTVDNRYQNKARDQGIPELEGVTGLIAALVSTVWWYPFLSPWTTLLVVGVCLALCHKGWKADNTRERHWFRLALITGLSGRTVLAFGQWMITDFGGGQVLALIGMAILAIAYVMRRTR